MTISLDLFTFCVLYQHLTIFFRALLQTYLKVIFKCFEYSNMERIILDCVPGDRPISCGNRKQLKCSVSGMLQGALEKTQV